MYPYGNQQSFGFKSPEQYQQEYQQIMQNYQNMYNRVAPNQGQPQANQASQVASSPLAGGEYKYITKPEDVETYPTRVDGTATLLIDFDNGVFWSKKFENGQHSIQTYKFFPMNTPTNTVNAKSTPEEDEPTPIELILQRLEKLEANYARDAKEEKE